MTDSELSKYIGKQCQILPADGSDWINGELVAVYSEIVSFNGYPYQREGLRIRFAHEAQNETEND